MAISKIGKSWWADFSVEGKRYRKKSPENTPAGARAYEKALKHKLAHGESLEPAPETRSQSFSDFAQDWFKLFVLTNNKASEQRTKESILRNHLLPNFGKFALNEIGAIEIEQYKASRRELGLTPKTVNNHLSILHKCLQTAYDWERLESMPKMTWLHTISPRRDFLTIEESAQLTTAVANEPMWNAMILLGLRTGMRLGELFGLAWEDIDLGQSIITIRRSIVEGVVSSPKTHRERSIAFPLSVSTALMVLGPTKGLVFKRLDGRPLSYGIAEHHIQRICKQAGLRHIGWHSLRHSCASQLAQLRGNSLEAQRLLGHTTSAMTDLYTHINASVLHDAVGSLDAAANLIKFSQPAVNTLLLERKNI